MSSSGTNLASGTRVSLRYCRESVRNTTPAGIDTAVDTIAAVATSSSGSGFSDFTRATGSFITDGFIKGQKVTTAGFSTSANNGTWIVHAVAAGTLTVRDPDDDITDETADVSQTVVIRLITLRATGRNVNLEKNILESQEVDADGQETDARHGFNRVAGAPGFQLGRADYDDWIEFAMGREWDTGLGVTSAPNLGVSTGQQITRATGSFITDGFRPGDIVRAGNFSETSNSRDWRVTAVAAQALTVVSTADGTTLPTTESEAGSKTLTIPGKRIDIGTDLCTVFLERAFTDILQYQGFKGVAVDQWQLNVEPESIINGTFSILGMSAAALDTTSVSASDPVGSSGNSPFAAFDGLIYEGGSKVGVATSLDFTLARNRSLNPVVGSKSSPDVFEGTARCSGTSTFYFQNAVILNKFIDETETSIYFRLQDPNNSAHFMSIVFPRIKYNGGNMDPPQEGPVPLEMPFRALKATGLAAPGGASRNSLMTVQVSSTLDI